MALQLKSSFAAAQKAAAEKPKEKQDYKTEAEKEAQMLQFGCLSTLGKEASNFYLATDTEYWCCLCFATRESKEEFLRNAKLDDLGDKYLDGHEVASRMKVVISPRPKLPSHTNSPGKRALALVLKK